MKTAQGISKLAPMARNIVGGAAGGGAVGALSDEGTAGGGAVLGGSVAAALPGVGVALSKLSNAAKAVYNSVTKSGRITTGHQMVIDQLPAAERDIALQLLQSQSRASPLGVPLTSAETFPLLS